VKHRKPTQKARLLKMLLLAGSGGLTAADLAHDPPDGGDPILRFSARLGELRRDGHRIVPAGRRNACTAFRLATVSEPARTPRREAEASQTAYERVEPVVHVLASESSPFDPWGDFS
jgi:hypothetical protein